MKCWLLLTSFIINLTVLGQAPLVFTGFKLNTSGGNSLPHNFILFKDKMLFNATNRGFGSELWISDGSPQGTKMVKDIWPADGSSDPQFFVATADKAYFSARDSNGFELWVTDGTEVGTHMVKDIFPGPSASYSFDKFLFKDHLLFSACDSAHGKELWISDGTETGTQLLKDIYPGPAFSSPTNFIEYKGRVFFTASDTSTRHELWVTDGTARGTYIFKNISLGLGYMCQPALLHGLLYFGVTTDSNGRELWVTDGTEAGTHLAIDVAPGKASGYLGSSLVTCLNRLFFYASDGIQAGLWVSDGNPNNTACLTTVKLIQFDKRATYKGRIYFAAFDDTLGSEPWVTDGTPEGTHIFKDIMPFSNIIFRGSNPDGFQVYKDKLYFMVHLDSGYSQLYKTDGSDTGTIRIGPKLEPPLYQNRGPSGGNLFEYNSAVWFSANYNNTDGDLWRMEDTTRYPTPPPFCIFPNPSNGHFIINTGDFYFHGLLYVFDALGRFVSKKEINGNKVTMDIDAPASGLYILRIETGNATTTHKLIIVR